MRRPHSQAVLGQIHSRSQALQGQEPPFAVALRPTLAQGTRSVWRFSSRVLSLDFSARRRCACLSLVRSAATGRNDTSTSLNISNRVGDLVGPCGIYGLYCRETGVIWTACDHSRDLRPSFDIRDDPLWPNRLIRDVREYCPNAPTVLERDSKDLYSTP